MTSRTNALLICVVFLCGLEETVLSQLGRCVGNQCYALFQKPENFVGALKSCKDLSGKLFTYTKTDMEAILQILPKSLSGSFWLALQNTGASARLQNCSSVSMKVGRNMEVSWQPCREELDGFLCQYTSEDSCSSLLAGKDAPVMYSNPFMGFDVLQSNTFSQGTVAVVGKIGAEYPDSKHVCLSGTWLPAPWSCEVLGGGCEHGCDPAAPQKCTCPAGKFLTPNKVTCSEDPCVRCAQGCQKEGDTHVCKCNKGYRLAEDKTSCVDVNECEEQKPCTGEGEECENTQGGFKCACTDGFVPEDGVCVNVTICQFCEHMKCDKVNGSYGCRCKPGYKVSEKDPTRCDMHCTQRVCPAECIPNPDKEKPDRDQCFCPDGYIRDLVGNDHVCVDIDECAHGHCHHRCENFFGGFRCLCNKGYRAHKVYNCVPIEEEEEEDYNGSGSSSSPPPQNPIVPSAHPAVVPSYIKTGSVLGITVFMLLCASLLFCLVQNLAKRCGKFNLSSLKHQNIDIFYLQQMTTETYKRLSFDKPSKNDPQIL